MAGTLSGHLLHAFNNGPAHPSSSTIVTNGTMSFDARAHGASAPSSAPFSPSHMPHAPFGFTPFSEDSTTSKRIATLQAKLNKRLGPEYISQRPGPGGGPKLTYAEGWKIINLANEVFGFNGWSSSIVNITTDFVDYAEESKRYNVGVTAIVRVTLRDGAYHEDVGYGMLENSKSKAAALDKCKKEAITDGLKRTLRNFGNLLGNCLYDKSYAQEVVKIKVPPAKFDKNELYRRPEFEERVPDAAAPASHGQGAVPGTSSTKHRELRINVEREGNHPETPHAQAQTSSRAATPPQRAQTHPSTSGSASSTIVAPNNRVPPPADVLKPNGLATPIQTPWRGRRPPPPRAPPPRPVATSSLARTASTLERSVSFTEPNPIPARPDSGGAVNSTGQDTCQTNNQGDGDDDPFPLSTQDGELFATVDLGRPIDFDEGLGGVSTMEESELEPKPVPDSAAQSPVVPPQPQPQVRDRAGIGSSARSPSSGPSKANARNEGQAQPAGKLPLANVESKSCASGEQAQSRSGPSNTASGSMSSTSSARAGPPVPDTKHPRPLMTSVGSPHYPPGVKPPIQHTPLKPAAPACVRTASSTPQSAGSNTNTLKRSADMMMQAGPSTRPPAQGMGLAQREQQQHHQHHQHVSARGGRPPDGSVSEGHDPKRLKR